MGYARAVTSWEPEGGWAAPVGPPTSPPPSAPPAYQPYQPYQPYDAPPQPSYQASYVPHPPPAAPSGKAHVIGPLSVVLAILLTVAVFGQLAAANAIAERADLIGELRLVNSIDESTLERADEVDLRVAAASAVSSLSWLVCGILWIVWQRRFVRNGSRFGPISPSLGWGTWGWLVPFANWFYPQAQLANAARHTDPHQLLGKTGMAPPILYVWWVLFGAASMLSLAATLSAGDAVSALSTSGFTIGGLHEAIDRLERSDQLSTLSYWINAGAALMAAATVLICTDRQRKLLTALGVKS
jgi:hypothetical protein